MQREGLLAVLAVTLLLLSALAPVGTLSYLSPRIAGAEPTNTQGAMSDGEAEELIVTVVDDESVVSSYPDTNYGSEVTLFVGMVPAETLIARSWLKFNLSDVSDTVRIQSAAMFVCLLAEYDTDVDRPIGSYYSTNDTWEENAITWNNQPMFSSSPSYVISSPPSPNMFVSSHWYSWDVTADVRSTIAGDKILTEVLKVIEESESVSCFKYFYEREYYYFNTSYLVLKYAVPSADNLAVDGYSVSPHVDYIMDSTPNLSWQFADGDSGDIQKGYELDIYEGASATGFPIWQTNTTEIVTIYSGATSTNYRPFGTAAEMRYQMKVPSSILSRTGVVDKLYFEIADHDTGYVVLQNLSVSMLSVSSSADLGSMFTSNYGGLIPVQVLYSAEYNATITDSWLVIDVQNTFVLSNRSNLLIEVRFMNNIGDLVTVNYTTSLIGALVAYTYGTGAYTSMTAGILDTRAHNVKIEFASTEVFAAGVSSNSYPFNWATTRMQFKYNHSLIGAEGYVDRIMFGVNQLDASATYYNLTILLGEAPVMDLLSEIFSNNYGGVEPTIVLQQEEYHPSNLGQWLVFDVANIFCYNNSKDLLIEISFDSRSGDGMTARFTLDRGGYRLYNMTDSHATEGNFDSATYELNLDMIHSEQQLVYGGSPLVNGTTYYFQAKVCDSTGVWSSFSSLVFRYQAIYGVPTWGNLTVTPSPVVLGQPVTVSIDVEYFLGVNSVLIEYGGSNYSMLALGVVYSHTWTPSAAGVVDFTIYMESFTGDWDTASGSFEVQQGGFNMALLIVGGVAAAAVVIVALLLHSRRKK